MSVQRSEATEQMKTFTFDNAQVRTLLVDGEPWWVAADVCAALGINDTRKSVGYLDEDERTTSPVIDSLGRAQETFIINEPGLYSLILRSRKPQAKAFKRWVTHEVIPTIRKTGSYGVAREMTKLEALRAAIESEEGRLAAEARAVEAEHKAAELEPAARAWDVMASTKGDYSLRDAAYILNRDPGICTGPRLLKGHLADFAMIDRRGIPYSKHKTHVVQRARTYEHPHTGEEMQAQPQLRVTYAGLKYLHGKLGGVAPLRFDQLELPAAS